MSTVRRRSARIQQGVGSKKNRLTFLPVEMLNEICDGLEQPDLLNLAQVSKACWYAAQPQLYRRGIFQVNICPPPQPLHQHEDIFARISCPDCRWKSLPKMTQVPYSPTFSQIMRVSFHIELSCRRPQEDDHILFTDTDLALLHHFGGSHTVREMCHVSLMTPNCRCPNRSEGHLPVLRALEGLVGFRTARIQTDGRTAIWGTRSRIDAKDHEPLRDFLEPSLGPAIFWRKIRGLYSDSHSSGLDFHPLDDMNAPNAFDEMYGTEAERGGEFVLSWEQPYTGLTAWTKGYSILRGSIKFTEAAFERHLEYTDRQNSGLSRKGKKLHDKKYGRALDM